ncbi:Membrane bound protein complex subunit mbxG [Halanaerobium saccharolyticum]|uniref:NADH-quinone oxidoreductase subunit K n=2 Tax=Halanaerobium saccharolyticum TaxID=43595 RepID=A0A4R6LMY6_9FIRM|nr:Membrane bound protein complex subunit mbxG [Halanaerobium saccharolyticum]
MLNFLEEWSFFGGSILLIFIGLYGVLSRKNMIKILISLGLMDTGVNLLLVALGYVEAANAPIINSVNPSNAAAFVDPIPQALVLTSIVIGTAVLALGLALVMKIYDKYSTLNISEIRGLKW